jgi:hypothetical protein
MTIHATGSVPPAMLSSASTGILLRLRVRFAGLRLDARLAAGEDPAGDPRLALRAARLASPRVRRRVAAGVERACRKQDRRAGFSAAIPVDARAVNVARPALLQLAAALRCSERVRAQGVALAQLLLTQAEGPLYTPQRTEALHQAAREAFLALGPDACAEPPDRGA